MGNRESQTYIERQPSWPAWLPIALQTEVNADRLRFRTTRKGHWREIPLSEVQSAEVAKIGQVTWPVGYKLSFNGEEAYITTSGQGVRMTLKGGRKLFLGSRDPQALLRALKPSTQNSQI